MGLKEEIREVALREGDLDFVGIAPVSRLSGAPEGSRPQEVLPKAKSLISLGIKLGLGPRDANRSAYGGHRQAIYTYHTFGLVMPGHLLEKNAYRLMRYLEQRGYPSIGIPHALPSDRLRLMGCVSHRHAAVAAGLGQFGLNGLLITRHAGCLVRLVTVVTEAEIEPDPLDTGPPICLGEKCNLCIDACPMDAFDREEYTSLTIDDTEFSYLRFKKWRCVFGTYGKRKASLGRTDCPMPAEPGPEDYLRAVEEEDPHQKLEGGVSRCGRCLTECPIDSSSRKGLRISRS